MSIVLNILSFESVNQMKIVTNICKFTMVSSAVATLAVVIPLCYITEATLVNGVLVSSFLPYIFLIICCSHVACTRIIQTMYSVEFSVKRKQHDILTRKHDQYGDLDRSHPRITQVK